MAKTARQIITSSLRKIGAIAAGETPRADEMQDGLSALQALVDSWSLNDLLAYTESQDTAALVPGQGSYTIGTGGDFDVLRPIDILNISVVLPTSQEVLLEKLTLEQWLGISIKTTQANFPTDFYFETGWPLAALKFWPVPTVDYPLIITSKKPIIQIASLATIIDLPPGYERALIYNLCPELVDEYGGELTNTIASIADSSLSTIKAQNLSNSIPYAASDGEFRGSQENSGWTLGDFLKGGS